MVEVYDVSAQVRACKLPLFLTAIKNNRVKAYRPAMAMESNDWFSELQEKKLWKTGIPWTLLLLRQSGYTLRQNFRLSRLLE
jgi:hypothetical protein